MTRSLARVLLVILVVALAGCQSKYMAKSSGAQATRPTDKATVVFLRPSNFGGAIQASVYDTHAQDDTFIGIVSAGNKLAYAAEPGDHLFMVVAENADFMIAHLEAGKTYYVDVRARPGVWKARFSLLPIHNNPAAKFSTQSADFQHWLSKTEWVEKGSTADQWYREHASDVREKKLDYMKKWDAMAPADKAELVLNAKDGI
jgi:hypothetical protein